MGGGCRAVGERPAVVLREVLFQQRNVAEHEQTVHQGWNGQGPGTAGDEGKSGEQHAVLEVVDVDCEAEKSAGVGLACACWIILPQQPQVLRSGVQGRTGQVEQNADPGKCAHGAEFRPPMSSQAPTTTPSALRLS